MDVSSPMHLWFALSEVRVLHVMGSCSIKWLHTSSVLVVALLLETQTLTLQ